MDTEESELNVEKSAQLNKLNGESETSHALKNAETHDDDDEVIVLKSKKSSSKNLSSKKTSQMNGHTSKPQNNASFSSSNTNSHHHIADLVSFEENKTNDGKIGTKQNIVLNGVSFEEEDYFSSVKKLKEVSFFEIKICSEIRRCSLNRQ